LSAASPLVKPVPDRVRALAMGLFDQPLEQGGVAVKLFHDVAVHLVLLAFDMRIVHPPV
jgi:hypothetical protein